MNPRLSRSFAFLVLAFLCFAFAGCKRALDEKSGPLTAKKDAPDPHLRPEPNVTFTELQGGDLPLASLKGKVVLVNFWATWCDPCRVEIPWMIGFQQKYASRGFTIVGVAMDEEGKSVVDPFVQHTEFDVDGGKSPMNYPIVIGNPDIAEKFGGLIGLPTSILLSREGKIVKRFIGLVDHDELQQDIESQLGAPAVTPTRLSAPKLVPHHGRA